MTHKMLLTTETAAEIILLLALKGQKQLLKQSVKSAEYRFKIIFQ